MTQELTTAQAVTSEQQDNEEHTSLLNLTVTPTSLVQAFCIKNNFDAGSGYDGQVGMCHL